MSKGVRYNIHYTSETEGITVGVSADSWVECLVALTDEFGEGVLPLVEKTKKELVETSVAVGESFEEEVANAQKEINRAIAEKVSKKDEPDTYRWDLDESQREALSIFEREDDDTSPAAEQENLLDSEQGDHDGEDAGSDEASEECVVCGIDIDRKQANYSELMVGETRCPDCMV